MQRNDESNVECRHVVLEGWFMTYVKKRGFRGLSVVVGIFAALFIAACGPSTTPTPVRFATPGRAHPLTLSATIAISALAVGEDDPIAADYELSVSLRSYS